MLIPWCTSDYRMSFCKRKARELRRSGKYARVEVRKKADEYYPGEGHVAMGKIYVERDAPSDRTRTGGERC